MKPSKIQNLVYKMLTESTGRALCDSGDAYGRGWERNQKRTIQDFINDPEVGAGVSEWTDNEGVKHSQYEYTISVFHYLTTRLELDDLCDSINRMKCPNWDSDIYGVSDKQAQRLEARGFKVLDTINTYNDDSNFSQILQYTYLDSDGGDCPDYVFMQIHNGCDARGGYTDAKLFRLPEAGDYLDEDVLGDWEHDGIVTQISNMYDGYKLTIEDDDQNGEEISPKMGDKITLNILEN